MHGRTLYILTVMDEFTREGLAIAVAGATSAEWALAVLGELVTRHGAPAYLRSDNGAEFVALAVQAWLARRQVRTLYIAPGCPWQNGKEERFNGTVRDECLNLHVFASLVEARVRLAAEQVGIAPQDVEITLVETPRANWGIRGRPGDELTLTYKVEV